jgi:ATP-dependent RNA helicase RhlE
LVEQLEKEGINGMAIHGNKSQSARTKALSEFKEGSLQVLVATDIAARGIDIDQLPHVVNYDLPNVAEDYVHRIGRTGRAGAGGEAVSLVCVDELKLLADIEKFIKRSISSEVVPGFEPDPNATAQPIQLRSQPGHRPGGQGRAPAKTAKPGGNSGAKSGSTSNPASGQRRPNAGPGGASSRPQGGAPATAARRSSSGSRGRG